MFPSTRLVMSLETRKQQKLTVKSTAATPTLPPSYQYFNIQIWIWIFNGYDNMTSFICHFWLLKFQYNIWYQILPSWFRYTTNDMVIYLLFSFWLGRGRFLAFLRVLRVLRVLMVLMVLMVSVPCAVPSIKACIAASSSTSTSSILASNCTANSAYVSIKRRSTSD